jgi:histidine triad (HIT) family protein
MATCAFCEIVRGAGDREIYRDDVVLAFLDRAPLTPGHTLVITHEHIETFEDLPSPLLAPFFGLAQRLSRAFGPALGAEGSLVALNTRISQSVPHVHAHVVPRRKGDRLFSPGQGPMLWVRRKYAEGEAERIAETLRAALLNLAP